MRFKQSKLGYFKLGLIFTIFSSVFSVIVLLLLAPLLVGGVIVGGIFGGLALIPVIGILLIGSTGWFLYWFFTNNKFTK